MGKSTGGVCLLVILLLLPLQLSASVFYPGFENFGEQPRAGKFLVASKKMRFTRFRETVIFLTRHDQKGTVGVIINRPGVAYGGGDSINDPLLNIWKHLYFGGPVEPNVYSILIEPGSQRRDGENAVRNLMFFSGTRNVIRFSSHLKWHGKYRIYAGYAGWYPGQLMNEIRQGAWHVMQGDSRLIFDRHPSFVWQRLIKRVLME